MQVIFTGRRPRHLGGYNWNPVHSFVLGECERFLANSDPNTTGHHGCAQGGDALFHQACLTLDLPVIGYVPFPGHGSNWPRESREQHEQLMSRATALVNTWPEPGIREDQFLEAMNKRNRDMVDAAIERSQTRGGGIAGLAAWDGAKKGGTWNCMSYMLNKGIPVTVIDLSTLEVHPYRGVR